MIDKQQYSFLSKEEQKKLIDQVIDECYDFGDNWHFDVLLEYIDPIDAKIKKPKIIASHGESPHQYGEDDRIEE